MRIKLQIILFFLFTSFLFAQEVIPKVELVDTVTVKWKYHEFYIGGGAGSVGYTVEFGYWVGGNVFGNKATYWGFAGGDRWESQKEENNIFITESPIYSTFFEFKYNSGFGFIFGVDFSKRSEVEKYSTTTTLSNALEEAKLIVGPYTGASMMFSKSKIGAKILIGTTRQISLIIDFGIWKEALW